MYWTNFRQPIAHVQQNIFGKTLIKVCSPHLYASFEVGLKIDKYVDVSECLKTHCAANNWPIWMQTVPKGALRCGLQTFIRVFTIISCCKWAVGSQK